MDRGDIAQGITLFRYSSTAQSNARARDVSDTLLDLYRRNEIGFHAVPRRPTLRGTWQAGRAGHDLRINTTYFQRVPEAYRLASLSLLLVHEATHATVHFERLYDEMASRMLPILYYRELSGPGVFNEATIRRVQEPRALCVSRRTTSPTSRNRAKHCKVIR